MQPVNDNTVNIPAFLNKLWRMVNDSSINHLISWNNSGTSFIILNQVQFWYELLPAYYKHNNMSSFVRQLNMYGFHKISTLDTPGTEPDKDEIQFYHPNFQKDKPELLQNIKRKPTNSKTPVPHTNENQTALLVNDDITKVLSDVNHLKGRQKNVDAQLTSMKQENAVLWRELALLRQKHLKQQQIVNKLIQFLVTMVQPPRMGGLGVKRQYSLMLGDGSNKKAKTSGKTQSVSSDGPIIHEVLDSADVAADELIAITESQEQPIPDHVSATSGSEVFTDSPEGMEKEMIELLSDNENHDDMNTKTEETNASQIFLNPTTQDVMLSDLMNGSYNTVALKDIKDGGKKVEDEPTDLNTDNMAIAKPDHPTSLTRLSSVEDMDFHVESTQNELDQLKELLNNCTTFDANTLLGLFNDGAPNYGLAAYNQIDDSKAADPMVSGSELTTYDPGLDFSQLFDESSEEALQTDLLKEIANATSTNVEESISTPQVDVKEPKFPTTSKKVE